MASAGYFKVHRKLLDDTAERGAPFCETLAWIDVIGLAEWSGNGTLARGKVSASVRRLSARWSRPRRTVRRWLATWADEGRIEMRGWADGPPSGPHRGPPSGPLDGPPGTVITVCNYEDYQGNSKTDGPPSGPHRGPPSGPVSGPHHQEVRSKEPSPSEMDVNLAFGEKSTALRYARRMRERILEVNARADVPTDDAAALQDWAYQLDLLNRLGPPRGKRGYEWDEIAALLRFVFRDDFWCTVVRGPRSLRRSVVSIENKMRREGGVLTPEQERRKYLGK